MDLAFCPRIHLDYSADGPFTANSIVFCHDYNIINFYFAFLCAMPSLSLVLVVCLCSNISRKSPQSSAQILHCVAGFSCDGMGLEELLVLLLQEACLSSINISHRSHHLECGQWGVDLQDFRLLQCSKLGKNPGCP